MASTVSGHSAIKYSRSPYLKRAFVPGRPVWLATRKAYLPLFLRLAVLLDQVQPLKLSNTWSFNYRPPRMGSGVSDHAGYAIDCWSDGIGAHTWPSKMPKSKALLISAILEKFKTEDGRHIFGWGACNDAPGVVYTGPTYNRHESNDPMHFFIAPGISTSDAARVIKTLGIKSDGTVK
jgi:hypothetical protein